jgi:hypothetical protein
VQVTFFFREKKVLIFFFVIDLEVDYDRTMTGHTYYDRCVTYHSATSKFDFGWAILCTLSLRGSVKNITITLKTQTSFALNGKVFHCQESRFMTALWTIRAPLGCPVLPEVYNTANSLFSLLPCSLRGHKIELSLAARSLVLSCW